MNSTDRLVLLADKLDQKGLMADATCLLYTSDAADE